MKLAIIAGVEIGAKLNLPANAATKNFHTDLRG
jgi:hypothetical protein